MANNQQIPHDLFSVQDYEARAVECMDHNAWSYLVGASADGITTSDNQKVFQNIKLKPRYLRSFNEANTHLELFGQQFTYPIFLAPVAWQKLFHQGGEVMTAQAASVMNAGMIVSTLASTTLEDVAQHKQDAWFQLYIQARRADTQQLVERAEQAGYKALVITVDAPISGVRNMEQRAGFKLPSHIRSENLLGIQQAEEVSKSLLYSPLFSGNVLSLPTWDDIDWLCSITQLPVLLKGICSPEDAEQAIQLGVQGLIVSNHGGRVLDTLPAAIEILPIIIKQVAGRVPVLMDGGVRRGTDIVKALALGAKAVLIGRPYIYALAVGGAMGVAHLLHILRAELEAAMVLTGCRFLSEIDQTVLW